MSINFAGILKTISIILILVLAGGSGIVELQTIDNKNEADLLNKLDENGNLEDVCIGTNEKFTAQEYLDRRRVSSEFHGQAPMLWTAEALILLDKSLNDFAK